MDTRTVDFSDAQFDLVTTDLEKVAIVGGKGSGKTFAGVYFICNMLATRPGSRGLILWNTYRQSLDIWNQDIKPALQAAQWKYEFNETKMTLRCFGCEVHLRSAEPEVMRNVESVSYHWGWGDEVSFWPMTSFKTFTSRIRLNKLNDDEVRPLIRVTSMPDEPDSWLYSMLERMNFRTHEIGLKDNLDKSFAESYASQLRAIYQGEQLRRYLDGERVSVAGIGLFAVNSSHFGNFPYDSKKDVVVCWDFNNEYRAVTWWQKVGKNENGMDVVACVRSFQQGGPQTTIHQDSLDQVAMLKDNEGLVYLHGDASGENKTAMATDSMWKTVSDVFYAELKGRLRNVVPKSNPRVKDTIECVNWALHAGLVKFDSTNARKCYLAMVACKADKYGEIDKSVDYKPGGVRTHEADTARYAVWHFYAYLYPGSRNSYFIV